MNSRMGNLSVDLHQTSLKSSQYNIAVGIDVIKSFSKAYHSKHNYRFLNIQEK
jgi:hypothetical protein